MPWVEEHEVDKGDRHFIVLRARLQRNESRAVTGQEKKNDRLWELSQYLQAGRQAQGQQRRGYDGTGATCTCMNVRGIRRSLAKYLKDNFLMYCKLGNDVRQK